MQFGIVLARMWLCPSSCCRPSPFSVVRPEVPPRRKPRACMSPAAQARSPTRWKPNCVSYDPTFAHEVGVILHHGLVRMVEQQDNVFFYLTLLNENYPQPGLRAGSEAEIIKGMYLLQEGAKKAPRVNLLGSGTILRESMAARELLDADWGIAANVWSCPSFTQLARDGQAVERWNLLHPTERPRVPFVAQQLEKFGGPVIASTDYMK